MLGDFSQALTNVALVNTVRKLGARGGPGSASQPVP